MEKQWDLATIGNSTLTCVEFHLSSPPILHDLIEIPVILQGIIEPNGFELISLLHPTIITVHSFKQ
jgi:hypothetical protein